MPIVKKEEAKTNDLNSDCENHVSDPLFNFDDLIIPQKTMNELEDAIHLYANQDHIFRKWGMEITHRNDRKISLNLYGPPGTGKTMAAHAIADKIGRKIITVSYADIESKYVGETPKNIRNVFSLSEKCNCVLFFDEADAMLSRRVTNMNNSTDVSVNQTRSVLLMLLNTFKGFVIFSTNFLSNYDQAFMRRMVHIEFPLPDAQTRKRLFDKLIPKEFGNSIDTSLLSEKYSGISGSDISNAVLKSAIQASRRGLDYVPMELIENSIEEIIKSKSVSNGVQVDKRLVTEQYVNEQLGDIK